MNSEIEEILNAAFSNKELMEQALTRKDYVEKINQQKKNSELKCQDGLDTLGDIILDYCIIRHFYDRNVLDPAYYDNKRQRYGNNRTLFRFSKDRLMLQSAVHWSSNEEKQKIWETEGKTKLPKCFEAIVGALYIDGGIEGVEKFLRKIDYFNEIESMYSKY